MAGKSLLPSHEPPIPGIRHTDWVNGRKKKEGRGGRGKSAFDE